MTGSTKQRWPRNLAYRHELELEIYKLQARLISDPDEREDILKRIEEMKAELKLLQT